MKKLILSVLFLTLSLTSFSQTFVKKYLYYITAKDNVLSEWKETSVTVVFNEKTTNDIVFYYSNGSTNRFHQIGDSTNDKTKSNEPYQIIMCIEDNSGETVGVQLFDDDDTLRVIVDKGFYLEYRK